MPEDRSFHRSPRSFSRMRSPACVEGPETQLGKKATPIPEIAALFNASKSSDRKATCLQASPAGLPKISDHPSRSLP